MASITYSTTGKTIREDTNLAFRGNQLGPATGFNEVNQGQLKRAIVEAGRALQVDANGTHTTAFTVQASVASTSVSIYIG